MRYRLISLASIAFFGLLVLVLFSQTRGVGARPCTAIDASSGGSARRVALVHNPAPCVREYLTEGPLYNPTFTYSNSSLSFEIPTMLWSALGKAVFVPATRAKAAPNTTTYWFLRVAATSPARQSRGSFVSSTSPDPGQHELLEYIVVSSQSGITWVRFPMSAQLRRVEWTDASSNRPNVGGSDLSDLTEVVAVSNVGVQTDSAGDGFFNGAVVANAAATPAPFFTGSYYGAAVVAQPSPGPGGAPPPTPTAQPGAISITNGILVNAPQPAPTWGGGQVAIGFPNTHGGNTHPAAGDGLRGLFTAGTAGNYTNPGDGVFTWGNHTQSGTWTKIDAGGTVDIGGVYNSVYSVLDEVQPNSESGIGCVMDAGGNMACSGGLYGNAAATPFPHPMSSSPNPNPTPTAADPKYEGPVVIAQATSPPTPQPGNVLVNGTLAGLKHNTCAASSGIPCAFTWTITFPMTGSSMASTNVTVPANSFCTLTATQTPALGGMNAMTIWVATPPPSGTLTVYAQVLTGTYSASFSGNGNCN